MYCKKARNNEMVKDVGKGERNAHKIKLKERKKINKIERDAKKE